MDDYLTQIREGFFYNGTLERAVKLVEKGVYNPSQLRTALSEGLREEVAKYRRWVPSDFSWKTNLDEANRALAALSQGKAFSYKGVRVNLPVAKR